MVLSHLHCDHAGCVEYFRKSRIIVHEDEFAGAFKHYAARDQVPVYILDDLDAMVRAELRWHQVGRWEPDQTLVEGVRLLNFGSGHAYGMLGLQVALKSQPDAILVSDACYTAENYGPPVQALRYFGTTPSPPRGRCGDPGCSPRNLARPSGSGTMPRSSRRCGNRPRAGPGRAGTESASARRGRYERSVRD